jgi:hypothetical protein
MKSKYIIGEIVTSPAGLEVMAAVIFPESIPHVDMAKMFVPETIISAGFVAFNAEGKPFSYDKSIGLGVESRGMKDTGFLEIALGMR